MYTIQYYKSKKNKPRIKEHEYNSDSKIQNCRMKRRYILKKDLLEKCWNIKSVTIDLEDIKHVIFDENLKHLLSLYARCNRIDNEEVKLITILNNNNVNLLYIYEIINCDWMINKDKFDNNDDIIIDKIKKLNNIIEQYEKNDKKDIRIKNKIKKKIILLKYYINSFNKVKENEIGDIKVLRLGNHFIKNRTVK